MDGTYLAERGPEIPGPDGDGWSGGSAGDTDGDGMADAVRENWRTCRLAVWTMRGPNVSPAGRSCRGPS